MYVSILKKIILLLLLFLIVTCDNLNFIDNRYYNRDIDKVLTDTLYDIEVVDSYVDDDYLFLPVSSNDLNIEWYGSSNPQLLSNRGRITRPTISQGESKVTINARCSYGSYYATRSFEFVISPKGKKEEVLNIVGEELKLVYVEPGELYEYNVLLTEPYYISKSVISKTLYSKVMGEVEDTDFPAVNISFENILDFCNKLSTLTGKNFTIPTEAQLLYIQETILLDGELKEWTCDALGDFPNINENPYNKAYPGDEIVVIDVDGNRSSLNYYDSMEDVGFRILLFY